MMDAEDLYATIMKEMKTLGEELVELRAENEELKTQIKKLRMGTGRKSMSGMALSNLAMEEVNAKIQSDDFLKEGEKLGEISEEEVSISHDGDDGMDMSVTDDGGDGMKLSESVATDPRKSSYATGYDYSLLTAKEILITMHDVGPGNRYIDDGPGMWVNYILTLERSNTLKVVNAGKLSSEGKYYHIKSIKKGLPIGELVAYCKKRGIRAIVPASVSDEIYCATHIKTLQAAGVYPFCCDDPQNYITLDHKWLSYEFCKEHGIAQSETLPLRTDTVDACRALAEKCIADGKPCFFKECFDTLAGLGVIKVDKMEDYDNAVLRITSGKGPEPADTKGIDQHIILQAGHPGRISCCHNIYYKGHHVSCYVTKENSAIMDQLGAYKLDMVRTCKKSNCKIERDSSSVLLESGNLTSCVFFFICRHLKNK